MRANPHRELPVRRIGSLFVAIAIVGTAIGSTSPSASADTATTAASTGTIDDLIDDLAESPFAGSTGRAGEVLRLYTTVFLRLPDQEGFDYWVDGTDWELRRMAAFFASSDEFAATYGALDDRGFVELMYQNVLGRPGEDEGVEFWIGIAGSVGRAEVVIGFSESIEYIARTTVDPAATPTERPEDCADVAAVFETRGSANASLADPEVSGTCDGDTVTVTSNGIPDYTYIQTSPGDPRAQDYTFTFPAEPSPASSTTDVPLLGPAAVAVNGVPIYGPTEGTGGDVLSLGGALSECGSHNGPTGFHMHLFGTSEVTDCLYSPVEVEAGPQLVGYAFDGYPIYTGNDIYTSSWQLTDASLFATDTWAAHSYVEGSGDLDECNGRVDENGDYAYYTTDAFPYVLGCYVGTANVAAAGGGPGR